MLNGKDLLVRFRNEIDLDLYLKLSPSCLGDFERRFVDNYDMIWKGQLSLPRIQVRRTSQRVRNGLM